MNVYVSVLNNIRIFIWKKKFVRNVEKIKRDYQVEQETQKSGIHIRKYLNKNKRKKSIYLGFSLFSIIFTHTYAHRHTHTHTGGYKYRKLEVVLKGKINLCLLYHQ